MTGHLLTAWDWWNTLQLAYAVVGTGALLFFGCLCGFNIIFQLCRAHWIRWIAGAANVALFGAIGYWLFPIMVSVPVSFATAIVSGIVLVLISKLSGRLLTGLGLT